MNEPKPYPLREVADKWRELNDKVTQVERLVIRLLEHPDTTPEQIAAVREVMHKRAELFAKVKAKLQEKYPDRGFLSFKWNKEK